MEFFHSGQMIRVKEIIPFANVITPGFCSITLLTPAMLFCERYVVFVRSFSFVSRRIFLLPRALFKQYQSVWKENHMVPGHKNRVGTL
jgi:hypothetical protein